jgi:hypothetical protein
MQTDNGAGQGYTQTDQERGITLGLTMEQDEAMCTVQERGMDYTRTDNGVGRGYTQTDQERGIGCNY